MSRESGETEDAASGAVTPGPRLLRAVSWLLIGKVSQGLASFCATLVIARALGPSEFGTLSLAIATSALFASFATLGLEHIASRDFSRLRHDARLFFSFLATVRRIRLVGALAGSAAILLATYVSGSASHQQSSVLLVLALLPLAQLGDVSEWRLLAAGKSRAIALLSVCIAPAASAARIGLAIHGSSLIALAWSYVVEWAVRSLLLEAIAREATSIDKPNPIGVCRVQVRRILTESAPLLASSVAVFLYMRLDQFMLAWLTSSADVGMYAAIGAAAEAPLVLPAVILRAHLPTMARLASCSDTSFQSNFVGLLRRVFYAHAALSIITIVFANQLIEVLFGAKYLAAVGAFKVLVLTGPLVAMGVLSSGWLVAKHMTSHAFNRTFLGLAVNAGLNLLLIPSHGLYGAAIATVIAQLFATFLADFLWPKSRALFWAKCTALFPFRGSSV